MMPRWAYRQRALKTLAKRKNWLDVLGPAEVTVGPCCGRRNGRRPSDSYPQRGDPAMSKSKSHKQQTKAAKAKKGAKPAGARDVEVSAPTQPQLQPDTAAASQPLPEAVVPPAP